MSIDPMPPRRTPQTMVCAISVLASLTSDFHEDVPPPLRTFTLASLKAPPVDGRNCVYLTFWPFPHFVVLFLYAQDFGSVPRTPDLIFLQKYRDTSGTRIMMRIGGVHTTFCQEEGIPRDSAVHVDRSHWWSKKWSWVRGPLETSPGRGHGSQMSLPLIPEMLLTPDSNPRP